MDDWPEWSVNDVWVSCGNGGKGGLCMCVCICVCVYQYQSKWAQDLSVFMENGWYKRHDRFATYTQLISVVYLFSYQRFTAKMNVKDLFKQMDEFACVSCVSHVGVLYMCVTLLTLTPSGPAAEQKVLGGVGSLVRGLTLPSNNRVPIETRHKTSCRRTTKIKHTCTSFVPHSHITFCLQITAVIQVKGACSNLWSHIDHVVLKKSVKNSKHQITCFMDIKAFSAYKL